MIFHNFLKIRLQPLPKIIRRWSWTLEAGTLLKLRDISVRTLNTVRSGNNSKGIANQSLPPARTINKLTHWPTKASHNARRKLTLAGLVGIGAAACFSGWGLHKYMLEDGSGFISTTLEAALPEYSLEEISRHKNQDSGIWITYGDYVFDVTEFVDAHPGGDKILLAAGGSIEPFWDVYTLHNKDHVTELLNTMKIGQVKKGEKEIRVTTEVPFNNPYANDPLRHPALLLNSLAPFDAETPPELLVDNLHTPNDLFFVRNHLPVPHIDENSYELEIMIPGKSGIKLSLEDLKSKFEQYSISATLMCTGNRRAEMGETKKVYGAPGGHTSISTAKWKGVKLRDVLLYAGLKDGNQKVNHIHFEGMDKDLTGELYGASIPVEKAMSISGDVLLAYEMNGEKLPKDHGYPLRVVIPGVVGARNVKWLGCIIASDQESSSFWQKMDYKSSPPSADWDKHDFTTSPPIYESPVQSAICVPKANTKLPADSEVVTVKGYAWSGGGNGIHRVDVSADGGKTWHTADLQKINQPLYRAWAWTLWVVDIPVPKGSEGKVTLCCKAVDTFHNVQPDSIDGIWNIRGFLNNCWHKTQVLLEHDES